MQTKLRKIGNGYGVLLPRQGLARFESRGFPSVGRITRAQSLQKGILNLTC